MSPAQKAGVLVALKREEAGVPMRAESALADHFREEQKLRVEPWRAPLALVKNALSLLGEAEATDLQFAFAELAKHGSLRLCSCKGLQTSMKS